MELCDASKPRPGVQTTWMLQQASVSYPPQMRLCSAQVVEAILPLYSQAVGACKRGRSGSGAKRGDCADIYTHSSWGELSASGCRGLSDVCERAARVQ